MKIGMVEWTMKNQLQKIQFDFDVVKEWFKLPCAQNLIKIYDPLFIYLGGSHLTPYVNEESDCDIILCSKLYRNTFRIVGYETEHFNIKGIHLHWYCHAIDGWVKSISIGFSASWIKLYGLEQKNLLYINPKYQKVVDFYFENKDLISLVGLYRTVLENDDRWQPWLQTSMGKIPYKGLYCVFWVAKEQGFLEINNDDIWLIKNSHGNVDDNFSYKCWNLFQNLRQQLIVKQKEIEKISGDLQAKLFKVVENCEQ